jgi:hypothetical protein
VKDAKDEQEQAKAEMFLARVDAQPITALVHLDGDTRADFVNLQAGKAVDAAHLLSLKIHSKMTGEKEGPALELAFGIAKVLHETSISPFHRQLRFDSNGLAIPFSTLCSKGASDLGTSVVGLAKVGLSAQEPKSAKWLAFAVVEAYMALEANAPELLVMSDNYFSPATTRTTPHLDHAGDN